MVDVAEGEGICSFRKLLGAHPEGLREGGHRQRRGRPVPVYRRRPAYLKATMLTHYNAVASTIQIRQWLHVVEDGKDRVLRKTIPFFRVYGMTVAMSLAIYAGAQLLVCRTWHIDSVIEVIDQERCPASSPAYPPCTWASPSSQGQRL